MQNQGNVKKYTLFLILFLSFTSFIFAQKYFNLGKKNFDENNFQEADFWLKKSMESDNENKFDAGILLSISNAKQNNLQQAELVFKQVLPLNPHTSNSQYNISLIYSYIGKYQLALNYADSALSLRKDDAYFISHKALVLSLLNDYKKAISEIKRALLIKPKEIDFLNNLGWYNLSSKNYDEAIVAFNELLQLDSMNAKAYLNRAMCFQEKKEYEKSIDDIDRALVLMPFAIKAMIQRGEVRLLQNKTCWACTNFEDVRNIVDSIGQRYIEKYCDNRETINYFPNGKVEEKVTYKNGKRQGKNIAFYENGKPSMEQNYIDGKRIGKAFEYHENGKVKKEAKFENDALNGDATEYYENGKVKLKLTYISGARQGKAISYFENGKVDKDLFYKDDFLEGVYKLYYSNGKLKEQGNLLKGNYTEKPKAWDEKGNEIEWKQE